MPIVVFNSEPVIYCPVCGLRRERKYYRDVSMVPGVNPIAKKIFDHRYIVFECEQCKANLIYDTKKETIKIKKTDMEE